jgi:hypothetical protein
MQVEDRATGHAPECRCLPAVDAAALRKQVEFH